MTKTGWYDDPDESNMLRWWTGTTWGPRHSKADGPPPSEVSESLCQVSEGEKLAKDVNRAIGLVFPVMAGFLLLVVIAAALLAS